MHFISLCLMVAYATKRTMIIDAEHWNYHKGERRKLFLPVSETCTEANESDRSPWPATNEIRVIDLNFTNGMILPAPELFQGIPRDLSDRINKLSGDPSAWWIGQIIKYLIRYKSETRKVLEKAENDLGFGHPIVGIHIRRSDKITEEEAVFHGLDEYMVHAQEFFDQLELRRGEILDKRRIYLASDDPLVFSEAQKK